MGRLPRCVRGREPDQIHERNLAQALGRASTCGKLTAAQKKELADLEAGGAVQPAAEPFVQEIRDLGRLPRLVRGTDPDLVHERNTVKALEKARTSGKLTAAQKKELADLEAGGAAQLAARVRSEIRADCPNAPAAQIRAQPSSGTSGLESRKPEPLVRSLRRRRRNLVSSPRDPDIR